MRESRTTIGVKVDAFRRFLLWHNYSYRDNNNIFVSEFPKSGGTWLCQLLNECTGIPFPRNQNLTKQPVIIHSHHLPLDHRRCIHLQRDGRDIMVSAYHYFLLSPSCDAKAQKSWRNRMSVDTYSDVSNNLAEFIGHFSRSYNVGLKNMQWCDFIKRARKNKQSFTIKYENLNQYPAETMRSVLHKLGYKNVEKTTIEKAVEKYKFKNQSGRNQGEEVADSFLRKGIVGDWKNYFNKESAEVFNFYAGEALIKAGYETRADWY